MLEQNAFLGNIEKPETEFGKTVIRQDIFVMQNVTMLYNHRIRDKRSYSHVATTKMKEKL